MLDSSSLADPYYYVSGLFPRVKNALMSTEIFKNENTYYFAKLGLRGMGGFYVRPANAVVVCYAPDFADEVTATHELLHCVRSMLGTCTDSRLAEENFAYTYSIPFLVDKGYPDEWIVRRYLWPFYREAVGQASPKKTFDELEELTRERCQSIIEASKQVPCVRDDDEDEDEGGIWDLI